MEYNYSRKALYHPEEKPVFVGYNPDLTFEIDNTGFSAVNAWWLSNASQLAYFDEQQIRPELEKVNLELKTFIDSNSTQGFLATGPGFAILSFRGTEVDKMEDLFADINISLHPLTDTTNVHKGFWDALDDVWLKIEPILSELEKDGVPVWYTGHSLGAALATLAAIRRPPASLYTFGSPMVGDDGLESQTQDIEIYRFVNCCDVVTLLPSKIFNYHHVGVQYFLTANGQIIIEPTSWQVIKQKSSGILKYAAKIPWLRWGMLNLRSLADHAIINYSAGIWRNILSN